MVQQFHSLVHPLMNHHPNYFQLFHGQTGLISSITARITDFSGQTRWWAACQVCEGGNHGQGEAMTIR